MVMSDESNVIVIDNPLVQRYLSTLRSAQTETVEFRNCLKKIAALIAFPVSQRFDVCQRELITPCGYATGIELKKPIALFPIMRSGLVISSVLEDLMSAELVSPIGIRRNRETLKPECYYTNIPSGLEDYDCFVLDPMLATGQIMCKAIECLRDNNARSITLVSIIAAQEGIEYIMRKNTLTLFCCAIDDKLNEKGYIVPGLGDVGDRAFGGADNARILRQ